MPVYKILLAIILALSQSLVLASEACFESAGQTYNIDSDLLRAIAWQESNFRVDAKNVNDSGSRDLGVMQINDLHYQRLANMGIPENLLTTNGCLNVFVGTFILAEIFKRHGVSWNSIGIYNAGPGTKKQSTIRNREKYASIINEKLRAVRAARHPNVVQPQGWLQLSKKENLRF